MPKILHHALNPKQIATAAPGPHSDGGGLELRVDHKGARRWVVRLKVAGKMTTRGLGSFPAVSLADARKSAATAVREAREAAPVPEPSAEPPRPDLRQGGSGIHQRQQPHVEQCQARRAVAEHPGAVRRPVYRQQAR